MSHNAPILYAEDDQNDVFFLQHAFEAAEIPNSVRVAKDGQDAIDYLSAAMEPSETGNVQLPCLILLDLKMPRLSGLEVLAWLRNSSRLPRLPVLIFSSSAHPREIERALALGANAFLVKPASVEERICLARSIKDFWLRFNHPAPMPQPV